MARATPTPRRQLHTGRRPNPGTAPGIAERVAFLRNSNFGLLWDVVSKPDPDSLAYTAHALALTSTS